MPARDDKGKGPLELVDTTQLQRDIKRRRMVDSTVVYSQAYSGDGTTLAAGSNGGEVCLWDVAKVLGQHTALDERGSPVCSFKAHTESIYDMVTYGDLLITTGGSVINAWRWPDLLACGGGGGGGAAAAPSPVWTLKTPQLQQDQHFEINSLAVDSEIGRLYAGSGDCAVYIFDVEAGKQVGTLSGHKNFIHSVAALPKSRRCATASEDGTVRLWDARTTISTAVLTPHKKVGMKVGKWLSSVAVDVSEDWLGCGGGVPGTIWHLRSNTFVTALKTNGVDNHSISEVTFTKGGVRTLGDSSVVMDWSYSGELKSTSPTSSEGCYQSRSSTDIPCPMKITTVCGASRDIDVYLPDGQKASTTLTFGAKSRVTSSLQ